MFLQAKKQKKEETTIIKQIDQPKTTVEKKVPVQQTTITKEQQTVKPTITEVPKQEIIQQQSQLENRRRKK